MEWIANTEYDSVRRQLGEINDCTVTAWAKVFDCPYSKAHFYMKRFGRHHRKGMTRKQIKNAFDSVKKAKIKEGPYSASNRICVSHFCKNHPKGRYYVLVRGHAFAIIDGVVYDYYDGPRRQITYAVRVYLEKDIPNKGDENV